MYRRGNLVAGFIVLLTAAHFSVSCCVIYKVKGTLSLIEWSYTAYISCHNLWNILYKQETGRRPRSGH